MHLLKYKAATAIDVDDRARSESIEWLRKYNAHDSQATFAVWD